MDYLRPARQHSNHLAQLTKSALNITAQCQKKAKSHETSSQEIVGRPADENK